MRDFFGWHQHAWRTVEEREGPPQHVSNEGWGRPYEVSHTPRVELQECRDCHKGRAFMETPLGRIRIPVAYAFRLLRKM